MMNTLDDIKQMMSSGDTAKAAEELKALLAKEPTNLQAKMLYGTCCQLLGDEETFKRIHDELAPVMEMQENEQPPSETVSLWRKYHALWMTLIVGGLVAVTLTGAAIYLVSETKKQEIKMQEAAISMVGKTKEALYGCPTYNKLMPEADEVEETRRKAEDEVRKELEKQQRILKQEEQRRIAEEQHRKMEELRRNAEEQQRALEELRRKAEERRRTAACALYAAPRYAKQEKEDAYRRAIEEARKKAEEVERMKIEELRREKEEQHRKMEEDARKRAEEAARKEAENAQRERSVKELVSRAALCYESENYYPVVKYYRDAVKSGYAMKDGDLRIFRESYERASAKLKQLKTHCEKQISLGQTPLRDVTELDNESKNLVDWRCDVIRQ